MALLSNSIKKRFFQLAGTIKKVHKDYFFISVLASQGFQHQSNTWTIQNQCRANAFEFEGEQILPSVAAVSRILLPIGLEIDVQHSLSVCMCNQILVAIQSSGCTWHFLQSHFSLVASKIVSIVNTCVCSVLSRAPRIVLFCFHVAPKCENYLSSFNFNQFL